MPFEDLLQNVDCDARQKIFSGSRAVVGTECVTNGGGKFRGKKACIFTLPQAVYREIDVRTSRTKSQQQSVCQPRRLRTCLPLREKQLQGTRD